MAEFFDRYGSEEKRAAAQEKSRCPTDFRCPERGDQRHSRFVREEHKLLEVMIQREEQRVLDGRIEIDDGYLGGERLGTAGRGSENKILVVVAVQTTDEGRPLYACFKRMPFAKEVVAAWANNAIAASAHEVSDGLNCFNVLQDLVTTHESHVVGSGRQAIEHPEFDWVNTIPGNLKTAMSGTYSLVAK